MKNEHGVLVCASDRCLWITRAVFDDDGSDAIADIARYHSFATVRAWRSPASSGGRRDMIIGSRDTSARVLIVAEIGNNHEGSRAAAEQMVREAARAGADAVKTQTFRTEHFVGRSDAARFARLQSFQLSVEDMRALAALARSLGLLFISTPLDLGSADGLEPIVDAFKIASGDVTFRPLIERVAGARKPVILSSGRVRSSRLAAHSIGSVTRASIGACPRTIRQSCIASAVTPRRSATRTSRRLRRWPGCGPSRSATRIMSSASMRPCCRSPPGRGLWKSTSPWTNRRRTFAIISCRPIRPRWPKWFSRIRHAEALLGDGEKRVQPSEAPNRPLIRRSAVAARDLNPGHVLACRRCGLAAP
jgi:N-acetylneuraminate synthase/N,N'-diacetyllegionaminate synthase